MATKRLSVTKLAGANLLRRPVRAAGIAAAAAAMAFAVFTAALLSASLSGGLESLRARLGADIAVVPLSHESDYEGIILTGEPETFYLPASKADEIAAVRGVEKVTAQFYVTTLAAECCTVPVQVVGIDPASDFLIAPWIAESTGTSLGDGALVVGSDIHMDSSGTIKFFDRQFKIAAQLAPTSTGMDNSVYADRNTIATLIEAAHEKGVTLNADVGDADISNEVSAVLIKTADGYSAEDVVTNIRQAVSGVGIVRSKSMFSGISESMNVIRGALRALSGSVWAVSALVLGAVFLFTVNGRKAEFGVLRMLGAGRLLPAKLVLTEAAAVCFTGAAVGTLLSAGLVLPFARYIGDRMNVPMLLPDGWHIAGLALLCVAASCASGVLFSAIAAVRSTFSEVYPAIREGESV
ncbi:MAG: ABC transporter permease [Oscillospiraceae bacterium]